MGRRMEANVWIEGRKTAPSASREGPDALSVPRSCWEHRMLPPHPIWLQAAGWPSQNGQPSAR